MLTLIIRTIIIYISLLITMRFMGKRQLGELDMSELVITILLSEIASMPITSPKTSLLSALIPIGILVSLEISVSFLIVKCPKFQKIFTSRPSVLICRGRIDKKEMRKVRISLEELISQIRLNGIFDLKEVDYAILEENGKMSIIPKARYRQPSIEDLNLPDRDSGVMHILVSDGVINTHGLKIINKSKSWLHSELRKRGITLKDVFCMTCNDEGELYIINNEGNAI